MLLQGLVCHLRWIFAVKRLWNFFLMRLFGRGSTRRGARDGELTDWKTKHKCRWRGEECSRFAVSVWQIHIKMTFMGPYKTTSTFVTSNHNNDFTYKGFFPVIVCGHVCARHEFDDQSLHHIKHQNFVSTTPQKSNDYYNWESHTVCCLKSCQKVKLKSTLVCCQPKKKMKKMKNKIWAHFCNKWMAELRFTTCRQLRASFWCLNGISYIYIYNNFLERRSRDDTALWNYTLSHM